MCKYPTQAGGGFQGGDKMLIDKIIKSIPRWTNVNIEYLHKIGIKISSSQLKQYRREFIDDMANKIGEAVVIMVNEVDDGPVDRPLTDLQTINLPFKSFFIEANIDIDDTERTLGIFCTRDNISDIDNVDLTIFIFLNELPFVTVFLNKDKLPRMYILCTEPCDRLNETGFIHHGNIGKVCLKTERNAYCKFSMCSALCIKLLIDVLHRFNDVEYEVIRVSEPSERKYSSSTRKQKPGKNVIKLSKVKRIYSSGKSKRTHASPTPHQRRGHYRHYKSGKVVWINQTNVGGKKPEKQTVYKL